MSTTSHGNQTLGRAHLDFAAPADIEEFVATLERFERGEISADEWRAFRLVRGTYGQRQEGDASMLRVKIPQGILDGAQLHALADVAERYARGFAHVTTRQNLQFHFLRLHDVEPAMRRLAAAGLTTREACGNTVRNVTTCPWAGVAAAEVFDPTPYAEALTRYLLRHPLSSQLPRKFKIAFEGCPEDHALTAINDLGLRARLRAIPDGAERGFQVTVGGGTAVRPTSGHLLFEFLPAGEILALAEAVLRVYQERGDYQHRNRNRLKYLIRELGFDAWRVAFDAALEQVHSEGVPTLPFDPDLPPLAAPPAWPRPQPPSPVAVAERVASAQLRGPGLAPRVPAAPAPDHFESWRRHNVSTQRQPGYSVVVVTLPLGDATGAQLRVLADLAAAYGDGTLRTTLEQNLLLRWVESGAVPEVYARLVAAGLGSAGAGTLSDVTACPGAESCRLAITQSRGLARLLGDALSARPELGAAAPGLKIKISGCPNGCGQNHIAGIGFQGSVRRLAGRVVPQYFVTLGGGVGDQGASFGRLAAKVPVRRVPEAVLRLLALYDEGRQPGEPPLAFFRRVDLSRVKAALADLEAMTAADALPEDFMDLGDRHDAQLVTLEGECSA